MAFRIAFTGTFDDYVSAFRARRKASVFGQWWPRFFAVTLIYVLAIFSAYGSDSAALTTMSYPALAVVVALFPIMFLLLAISEFLFDRLVLRLGYFRSPFARQQIAVTLDPSVIVWSIGRRNGSATWSAVKQVYKDRNALVLLLGRAGQLILPRRAFVADEVFAAAEAFARARVAAAVRAP